MSTLPIEHIYAQQFLNRLETILVERDLPNGVVEKRGGLSNNAIASITYRIRQDPSRFYRMEFRTMMSIAKGCNVDVFWLFFGRGEPGTFTDMVGQK